MASLDSLPADQRAVLQLVLQRGRSYDDIAQLLSIERAAVRERALAALDALGPQTRVLPERRALITDYLLGQLPSRVSEETRTRLAESASERAWARVVGAELAVLASDSLPEIPPEAPGASPRPAAEPASSPRQTPEAEVGAADSGRDSPDRDSRPSSRRGGAILLGVGALIAVVVVILISVSGGSSKHHTSSTVTTPARTSASTTTSSTGARVVAQINLVSPNAGSKTAGIAEVLKQGNNHGIAIVAQAVPPNTKHDAYAVWLYNSPSDSHILGFVNPGVGTNRRLSTAGGLPANANHFRELIVTLESQANPRAPGKILLQGALSLS